MKRVYAAIVFILMLFEFGLAQSDKEVQLIKAHSKELWDKSLMVRTRRNNEKRETGTGFVVNKNGKLYLVTNYHIVPGFDFIDTTKIFKGYKAPPNKLVIYFHTKTDKNIVKIYDLYDKNNRRNFFSFPMTNIALGQGGNSIIDICYIPLGKLDSKIKVDTVRIFDNIKYNPKPKDLVAVWGFRGEIIVMGRYCPVDTGLISKTPYFNSTNLAIVINVHMSLAGSSGAPVYYHGTSKPLFIGIESAGTFGTVPDEFSDNTPNQQLALVLTKEIIRYGLEDFVH